MADTVSPRACHSVDTGRAQPLLLMRAVLVVRIDEDLVEDRAVHLAGPQRRRLRAVAREARAEEVLERRVHARVIRLREDAAVRRKADAVHVVLAQEAERVVVPARGVTVEEEHHGHMRASLLEDLFQISTTRLHAIRVFLGLTSGDITVAEAVTAITERGHPASVIHALIRLSIHQTPV